MQKKYLSVAMTKREILSGLIFLPFYLVLLSLGLQILLLWVLRRAPSTIELNICFYAVNIVVVLVLFHRFLLCTLQSVRWKKTLLAVPVALLLYFALNFVVNLVVLSIRPDFANQNNDTVVQLLGANPVFAVIMAVILAPIIEETLFRGLIFGNLLRVNRLLAYAVTALGFAAIHVVSYLGTLTPLDALLSILQYLPAAVVLGALYEHTDNLTAPILLHAAVNLIGCLAMNAIS